MANYEGSYPASMFYDTEPDAPTGLFADVINSTSIDLIWLAPENDGGQAVTGYIVEYSTDSGDTWTVLDTVPGLSVTVSPLAELTAHIFRVAAENSVGVGPYSETIVATTTSSVPPIPPPGYADISVTARLNEIAGVSGESLTTAANVLAGTTGESLTTALNIAAGTSGESATTALNILAGTTGEPAAEAARKIGSGNVIVG